jgi:hypothetical protein
LLVNQPGGVEIGALLTHGGVAALDAGDNEPEPLHRSQRQQFQFGRSAVNLCAIGALFPRRVGRFPVGAIGVTADHGVSFRRKLVEREHQDTFTPPRRASRALLRGGKNVTRSSCAKKNPWFPRAIFIRLK